MNRTLISGFSVRCIDHLCQSSVCRPEMNRTFTWRARIFHSTIKLRGNSNLRKRRDLNPRCLAARRFSRPVQSTNSATLPNLWRMTDSNRRPPACKAGALANWANSPISCGDTTRTCDLQVMSLTSYQLLYSAILFLITNFHKRTGLEPVSSPILKTFCPIELTSFRNFKSTTASEELNIFKSSHATFFTFTPCIFLQGSSKR